MDKTDILRNGIREFNIEPTDEMIERFEIYSKMLVEWNKKINLTTITDENEIVIKHFLDSISCVQSGIDFSEKKVIDVGTGAGFPGVPLKIVMPDMDITLLDSLNKRTIFLSELMENMGLKCSIIHGRAEDYGRKEGYREAYDIVLSRAVANMSVLVEYMLPYTRIGGHLLCQKGPAVYQEVEDAKNAIGILGGRIKEIISTNVYNSDFTHYIAVIEKVKLCPGKYPRKAGAVEKNPIK
jgi:16S rRNA (guanine527-N7)-methyltransferase